MQQVVSFVVVVFVVDSLVLLLLLLLGKKKKKKRLKEKYMKKEVRMLTLVQKELLVLTSDFVSIPCRFFGFQTKHVCILDDVFLLMAFHLGSLGRCKTFLP